MFLEEDFVYLKFQPYRQQSVARRQNKKLAPTYFGPYEIIIRIGPFGYKLPLPDTATLHPVFHVSQLNKAIGQESATLIEEDMEITSAGASEAEKGVLRICLVLNLRGNRL